MQRALVLAVITGCALSVCAGCAGARAGHLARSGATGLAPDDAALHPNPNAPYILPGGTPRLIRRASAEDAANAGPCDPEMLSAEEIAGDTNGVFRSVRLAFMNRGPVPCRLGGYPTVALLDAEGERVGSITSRRVSSTEVLAELGKQLPAGEKGPAPSVTLMPQAVAAFQIVWTTGAECSRVSRIQVTAPGSRRTFGITQPMKICTGQIQVTELRLDEGDV
ncbi:MAG TPA: DUF4232 domain-containing protein [Acidobacteriaceae bacterium]|jgi:hypothetical protein|nr:DUF4232 domain-containing protein [Acidobacteriaceae bacterium]